MCLPLVPLWALSWPTDRGDQAPLMVCAHNSALVHPHSAVASYCRAACGRPAHTVHQTTACPFMPSPWYRKTFSFLIRMSSWEDLPQMPPLRLLIQGALNFIEHSLGLVWTDRVEWHATVGTCAKSCGLGEWRSSLISSRTHSISSPTPEATM